MTAPTQQVQIPAGLVVITTYGVIRHETLNALGEMRSLAEKNGVNAVAYRTIPGNLVEKARNEAVRMMLREPQCGWLLQIDGDMVWHPDALVRLLRVAYVDQPTADVVGAYCSLRGDMALPTIDSGTGTWESHFPGSGVIDVIRTGAAFILCKRHCFERVKEPWFRMRVPARPVDFMAEVDNWARMKFDGRNPFRGLPEQYWERLEQCAEQDPSTATANYAEVGEDSGFCDRARNAGLRIVVDTDIEVRHVDTKIVGWEDHKRALEDVRKRHRLASGMLA